MTLACINAAAMGLLAASFAAGPYFSFKQELWYRYGSIGFILLGAVLPGGALLLAARRYPIIATVAVGWMLLIWLPFAGYVLMSGGGI